jgi:catechol 2,3-dioxygenase-like lactoylglutathione lyase family enzyme
MSHKGFSHIGLATLDMKTTRAFYEGVMGFSVVVDERINIAEGGSVRHVFFDIGRDQLLAFMEARDVSGVPTRYDAGINEGLGVPASFYHFAFEAGSPAALAARRCAHPASMSPISWTTAGRSRSISAIRTACRSNMPASCAT